MVPALGVEPRFRPSRGECWGAVCAEEAHPGEEWPTYGHGVVITAGPPNSYITTEVTIDQGERVTFHQLRRSRA